MKFPFRRIDIHDLHLAHNNVHTLDILNRLGNILTEEKLKEVNLISFNGDVFDQVVLFGDTNASIISLYFLDLFKQCEKYEVSLRFLFGTPSHDANQAKKLVDMGKHVYPHLDIEYIDDMIIEHHEKYDIHTMYVPDAWDTREKMYLKALDLLREHQLDQVDFISGHNQFYYQFPESLRTKISALVEEDWNKLVRYQAYFGHVHKRSQYKKINVVGSFDRLTHGYEEPKGLMQSTFYSEENHEFLFIENKEAELFKQVELPKHFDYTRTEDIKQLITLIESYQRDRGFIEFSAQPDVPLKDVIELLKPYFPNFRFTLSDKRKPNKVENITLQEDDHQDAFITITRDNLYRLVEPLSAGHPLNNEVLALLKDYIEQV